MKKLYRNLDIRVFTIHLFSDLNSLITDEKSAPKDSSRSEGLPRWGVRITPFPRYENIEVNSQSIVLNKRVFFVVIVKVYNRCSYGPGEEARLWGKRFKKNKLISLVL